MVRSRMILSCLFTLLTLPLLCCAQAEPQTSAAPLPRSTDPEIAARDLRLPGKALRPFSQGTKLLAEENSAASIREFQRAIKVFPDFYEAYYKIGIAELNLQHHGEAQPAS